MASLMRTYELMMITRGALDEPAVQQVVQRFTKVIADRGGDVQRVDHWGKRAFAYEIDHMTEGYYTVVDFTADGTGLLELERQLRLADEIVRHKVVRPAARVKRRPTPTPASP
jgi:small subunit ribosomal protein S6